MTMFSPVLTNIHPPTDVGAILGINSFATILERAHVSLLHSVWSRWIVRCRFFNVIPYNDEDVAKVSAECARIMPRRNEIVVSMNSDRSFFISYVVVIVARVFVLCQTNPPPDINFRLPSRVFCLRPRHGGRGRAIVINSVSRVPLIFIWPADGGTYQEPPIPLESPENGVSTSGE